MNSYNELCIWVENLNVETKANSQQCLPASWRKMWRLVFICFLFYHTMTSNLFSCLFLEQKLILAVFIVDAIKERLASFPKSFYGNIIGPDAAAMFYIDICISMCFLHEHATSRKCRSFGNVILSPTCKQQHWDPLSCERIALQVPLRGNYPHPECSTVHPGQLW